MPPSTIKVLCVEDEEDIRTLLVAALSRDDAFEIRAMPSAADALALMSRGEWIPDIALLDMLMPDMTGTDLLFAMRALPGLPRMPVIFLTASVWAKQAKNYSSVGAIGLIPKPFDPMTLAQTVREYWASVCGKDDRSSAKDAG